MKCTDFTGHERVMLGANPGTGHSREGPSLFPMAFPGSSLLPASTSHFCNRKGKRPGGEEL